MKTNRRTIRIWFVMLSILIAFGGSIPPVQVSASTDSTDVIYAKLGNEPDFEGLTVLPGDTSTTPQAMIKGGEQSWGTNKSGGVLFMYLNAAPGFFMDGESRVEIAVDYYDSGTGKFNLMYANQGGWQEEKYVQLTGSNTWKTHKFYISDGALITKMRLGLYGPKMGSSQEDVFFKSVTITKLQDFSEASSVQAVLDGSWNYEGVKVKLGINEKYAEPTVSYDSRTGWSTKISDSYAHMYFHLDSSYGSGRKQKVSVDYFDKGTGTFQLRYTSANGNLESEKVKLTDSNEWKTYVFQSADIDYSTILLTASGEDIIIGSIEVAKENDTAPEPDHETVAATLGMNPVFDGLNIFPGDPLLRGQMGKVEAIGGKDSWRTDKSNSRSYLYMEVKDEEFISGGNRRVEVAVEYFDGPVGKFALSYQNETGWRDMQHIKLTGTNSWKTARFIVLQADLTKLMRVGLWSNEMGSSETDVYFSHISIRHLNNYSDNQTVQAQLNSNWEYEGINVYPGDNAKNKAPIVAREGAEGWATDSTNGAKYLYFNVDDTYVHDVDIPIEIEVTYFDEGKGTIVTEFDGKNGGFVKANPIQLTDSGVWKTTIVTLPHAKFSNRTNGSDFRLSYTKGSIDTIQNMIISSVAVSKYVPETRDMKIIPTTTGNVFLEGEPISLNLKTVADKVEWKLENYWGKPFGEGSSAVETDGKLTLSMPELSRGYYKLELTALNGEQVVKKTTTPIMVLSSNADTIGQPSPYSVATHFGQKWDPVLIPLVSRLGVSTVRDELYWGAIEKEKGVYDFPDYYDTYMAALKQYSISPFIVLSYGNDNYPGGPHVKDPIGVAGYAKYAVAVLNHYGDQIKDVEVHNEYNAYGGGAAPSYYYPLLKETYTAVKSVRDDVRVIGPAGVTIPYDWIEELFKLGGLNYLDGVSVHPYRFPQNPEGGELDLDKMNKLIAKYNTSGKEIPLWLTEAGWHTRKGGDGISEDKQAEYLVRYNVLALSEGVEHISWYDLKNDGTNLENREHNFGIIVNEEDERGAYIAKPSFASYAVQTRVMTGAEFVKQEQVYGNVRSYLFQKNNEDLRVLWSLTPQKVALSTSNPVVITDFTGEEQTLEPLNGKIYLKLGDQPLYVHGEITGIQAGGLFSADNVVAAKNDLVRVNVKVDNSNGVETMEAEVEVAGIKQTVNVPAHSQENVVISLPAVAEIGNRTYIANIKVDNQFIAHLLVNAQIEEAFEVAVEPNIVSMADKKGQLKVAYVNNSSVSEYTLTSLEWKLGEQYGSQEFNEVILPASTWTGGINVPITAYGKQFAYQIKLNFKEAAPLSVNGYTEFSPIIKKTASGEKLQEIEVPEYAFNLVETGNNRVTGWKGPDDLSGDFWLNWDVENFYLTAKIKDDIHFQDQCGSSSWTGDGIQFALFSGIAGSELPDKYEYGFALCPSGQSVVHRWITPQGVEAGDVTNVEAKVVRDEETKHTYYYIALPWSELAPIHPDKGMLSFGLLFNENDGTGRREFFEWGGGIGSSKDYKELRPMQFMDAVIQQVDKSELTKKINEARQIYNAAITGNQTGQYPVQAKEEFLAAIEAAESVKASTEASQATVDEAIEKLKAALLKFEASKVKGNPVYPPGNGGGSDPQTPIDPSIKKVSKEELKHAEDGRITILLGEEHTAVLLPSEAAQLPDHVVIELKNADGATIVLPAALLTELSSKGESQNGGGFRVNLHPADATTAQNQAMTSDLTGNSPLFTIGLTVLGSKGEENQPSQFPVPITIKLPYEMDKLDAELLGIYYYNEKLGSWEYVGGKVDKKHGNIEAEVLRPGQYKAMLRDKRFSDVAKQHWAFRTLQILSAKHLISGVSEERFNPEGATTRAEFTALLVRTLGLNLSETATAPFSDVPAAAWYADYITAAHEAGIVRGVSESQFAPNERITREQMAALTIRAYEYLKDPIVSSNTELNDYSDAKHISPWAVEAINKAVSAGLMKGKATDRFDPRANATRAEAAQLIYNLLQRY